MYEIMLMGEKMKKEKTKLTGKKIIKRIIIALIIILIVVAACFGIYKLYQNYITKKATEHDWIADHVSFNYNNDIGKNVITVNKNKHIS